MGACPDTCCKDWQVVIDEQTLAYYRSVGGQIGEKLRACIIEQDGEWMFDVSGGCCPLLTEDGLCSVQKELGEEHLCRICYAHPRFIEQYGMTEEIALSVSCPAAARLLLQRNDPVRFVQTEDGRELDEPCELDPELYSALCRGREMTLALVQDERFPFADRLCLVLLFNKKLQELITDRRLSDADRLIEDFSSDSRLHRSLARLRRMRGHSGSFARFWMLLQNAEHLTEAFPALLQKCGRRSVDSRFWSGKYARQMENLLVYFLFRYYKKAVNDGKLLARVNSCVFHLCAIRQLFCALPEQKPEALISLCSLYSKEIEHSDENRALLLRTLGGRPLDWKSLVYIL